MTEVFDSSDQKQVQARVKSAKSRAEVREEGLRQLLKSQQGRAWLWGLLESLQAFKTPYSRDAIQMAFNCGRSEVGLELIAEVHKVDADLYLVMAKENHANG